MSRANSRNFQLPKLFNKKPLEAFTWASNVVANSVLNEEMRIERMRWKFNYMISGKKGEPAVFAELETYRKDGGTLVVVLQYKGMRYKVRDYEELVSRLKELSKLR